MASTTPPWRSLDAPTPPSGPGEVAGASPTLAPDAGGSGLGTPSTRIVLTVGGALACAILAVVLATSGGSGAEVVVDGGTTFAGSSAEASAGPATGAGSTTLVVEIVGAVRQPGVYRLAPGSRIGDLVAAAGGYGARIDTTRAEHDLNLAAPLRDGDQVRVPSRDDPVAAGTAPSAVADPGGAPAAGPIDLNQATAAQLDALPGIGPVTADKIMAARAEAPFNSVDDLRTRGLVGEKTFEKIRASLMVP